jgi:hypothetical protein
MIRPRHRRFFLGVRLMTDVESVRPHRVLLLLLLVWCTVELFLACRPRQLGSSATEPAVGSQLPSLLGKGKLRNAPIGVPAPTAGWVIYAFSPTCAGCAGNTHDVELLARSLPQDWQLLSVSTADADLVEYLHETNMKVPVIGYLPAANLAEYRAANVPRTYVLDSDWKLLEVLDGPFTGRTAKRLSERFGTAFEPHEGDGRVAPTTGAQQDGPKPPASACLDHRQSPYSAGATAEAMGLSLRCGAGGWWLVEG